MWLYFSKWMWYFAFQSKFIMIIIITAGFINAFPSCHSVIFRPLSSPSSPYSKDALCEWRLLKAEAAAAPCFPASGRIREGVRFFRWSERGSSATACSELSHLHFDFNNSSAMCPCKIGLVKVMHCMFNELRFQVENCHWFRPLKHFGIGITEINKRRKHNFVHPSNGKN